MQPPVIAQLFVLVVAIQHIAFGVIEMFFWAKPLGRKIFRTEANFAEQSKVLAANQGLYNFFLAAGLLFSFWLDAQAAHWFRYFFLSCVVVAGLYGGYSVSKRIFYIQAAPAGFGLFFLALGL